MTSRAEVRRPRSIPARGSRSFGITVWAISWGLVVAALGLAIGWGLPREPVPGLVLSQASTQTRALFPVIGVTVALVYGPVAALLLFRRVNVVGVILAVHALGSGIGAFGAQWGILGVEHPGLPLWGLLGFASGWSYIPGTFMTAVLPILVTRARIPRWQAMLFVAGAITAAVATFASLVQQSIPLPRNPLAIPHPRVQEILPDLYLGASFVAVALACVTGGILVVRWIRAAGSGRTGLAWLTVGHLFLTCSYAVLVLPEQHPLPEMLAEYGLLAPVLGQVLYPAAILVVVLGQGLWGQQVVLSRIILWALLTISGVGIYFALVLAVPRVFPWPEGMEILVPLLIAIAIQPMRSWIQRRIDQLIYGEGADSATLLARLGERIGELETDPGGLEALCEALRRELRLASVEIVQGGSRSNLATRSEDSAEPRRQGGGSELARAQAARMRAGKPVGVPVRIPIERVSENSGEPIAELVVSAPGGQRLDRRSLSVLRDLRGLLAAALHLVESNRRLDDARSELFAERAEERRAMQRELHDGLGPALAGAGFGLAAARNLVHRNPVQAGALIAELEHDLAKRARAVRRLAEEVTPSPLDGGSLTSAITGLAGRFRTEQLSVSVEVGSEVLAREAPLPVQDALYFIAAEALTNAARHSKARHVHIDLRLDDDAVSLCIVDDGHGLPAEYRPGVGLASIRRRAEQLGGELLMYSEPTGLRIIARIPIPRPTAISGTSASGRSHARQPE